MRHTHRVKLYICVLWGTRWRSWKHCATSQRSRVRLPMEPFGFFIDLVLPALGPNQPPGGRGVKATGAYGWHHRLSKNSEHPGALRANNGIVLPLYLCVVHYAIKIYRWACRGPAFCSSSLYSRKKHSWTKVSLDVGPARRGGSEHNSNALSPVAQSPGLSLYCSAVLSSGNIVCGGTIRCSWFRS